MKDILIKRNELRSKSVYLKSLKFDANVKDHKADEIAKEQDRTYNKWNFYDKFIKAREVVKNETKLNNVGKS